MKTSRWLLACTVTIGCHGETVGSADEASDSNPSDVAAPVDSAEEVEESGDVDDDVVDAVDVAPGSVITVVDADPKCWSFVYNPLAGEESFWVAARIAPPVYPFQVEKIEYALLGGAKASGVHCVATLPHRLMIFQDDGDPPDDPTVLATVDVPAGTVTGDHTAIVTLDTPVEVTAHNLYVAVQWAGTYPNVLCLAACAPSHAKRTFQSSSATAPFLWADPFLAGNPGDVSLGVVARVM